MAQYSSLNVKLSNSQLNKLKSAIKNETEVVLRLSLNMVGDEETNFPHKLLLTNRQVENLCKAFASKSSTDITLSKSQLSKMAQSGVFLSSLLGPDDDPLYLSALLDRYITLSKQSSDKTMLLCSLFFIPLSF